MAENILPYYEKGPVVPGFGRGSKQLGIPTANYSQKVVDNLPSSLDNGIYFGFASVSLGEVHPMVMSVGWNPTYQNKKRSMETHLIYVYPEDFYGEELRVCILGYLREEKRFTSEAELVEAIHEDIRQALEKLEESQFQSHRTDPFFSDNTAPVTTT